MRNVLDWCIAIHSLCKETVIPAQLNTAVRTCERDSPLKRAVSHPAVPTLHPPSLDSCGTVSVSSSPRGEIANARCAREASKAADVICAPSRPVHGMALGGAAVSRDETTVACVADSETM